MRKPCLPAFDPADVAESNATSYPAVFRADNSRRWNRRLGDHVGIGNFGVNLTRLVPGAQSSARHAHSKQDEFIWVVSGEVVLETNEGAQTLRAGMCAGFPAGCGNAHRFVNRSGEDATLLVIGDRTPFDEIDYPDIDNRVHAQGWLAARLTSPGASLRQRKTPTPLASLAKKEYLVSLARLGEEAR